MQIKFTPSARHQFLNGLKHIQKDNPSAAARYRRKAENSLCRLIDFPDSGRTVREFPDLPYRELFVSPFRFFYRMKDSVIWIVAVWHAAQLPKRPT